MTKSRYDMNFHLSAFETICNGTDFELLIIGQALIDRAHRNVLEAKLKCLDELSIFDIGHALSDYSKRVEMCRALDFIDSDLWEDLKIVGRMRNDAAHLNTEGSFSLGDETFKDRISSFHEIETLKWHPELLQEGRSIEKRTGVLYEGARSQLLWSLTEVLCKLAGLAPTPFSERPAQKYQLGDRVKVRLTTDTKVFDLKGRSEAVGTIVDAPWKISYNVRLDEPPGPDYNTITYLTDDYIIEKL